MEPIAPTAANPEPSRAEIDRLPGRVLLEFGASWCGHCRALAPKRDRLLREHPEIRHLGVEDGPGRPLGRSFGVKLWPTLVFLRDGRIITRLVRPDEAQLRAAFEALLAEPQDPDRST